MVPTTSDNYEARVASFVKEPKDPASREHVNDEASEKAIDTPMKPIKFPMYVTSRTRWYTRPDYDHPPKLRTFTTCHGKYCRSRCVCTKPVNNRPVRYTNMNLGFGWCRLSSLSGRLPHDCDGRNKALHCQVDRGLGLRSSGVRLAGCRHLFLGRQ